MAKQERIWLKNMTRREMGRMIRAGFYIGEPLDPTASKEALRLADMVGVYRDEGEQGSSPDSTGCADSSHFFYTDY